MNLNPMRFKDYVWPHNPETFSVSWQRQIAVRKIPFGGCCMQDLGLSYRVMRGEGCFAGMGAYEEFEKLNAVFNDPGPGLLSHPVWQTTRAYFAELSLAEEPLPDYVHYTFVFWEDGRTDLQLKEVAAQEQTGQDAAADRTAHDGAVYIVKKGDTLWGIARSHGVALADLIAANPQIKNPNLIYPGDRVKLS